MQPKFTYVIQEHLGTIGEGTKGWTKELNIISWNGAQPVFDIRSWSPDHTSMGKGITLSAEEAATLLELLRETPKQQAATPEVHDEFPPELRSKIAAAKAKMKSR